MSVKNEKIKLSLVGLGIMGQLYADYITSHEHAELVAVADTSDEALKNAKSRYNCLTFNSYNEMFEKVEQDATIIVLPDHLHRDAVTRAAQSGINIWIEKPFSTSLEDAVLMYQAIKQADVKCTVEFFNRWSRPFAAAQQMVANGELGEILTYSVELNDTIAVPTQMLKWSAKSSPVWFLMSHSADLAFWITNKKPKAVFATGVKKKLISFGIDTYDLVDSMLQFEDGTTGRISSNWVLPEGMPIIYELKMRLSGSDSSIDIDVSDQQLHHVTNERYLHPVTDWGKILGKYQGHPYSMLDSFICNIKFDTDCEVDAKAGLDNVIFLDAVNRSLESKKSVEIDWDVV